MLVATGVFGWLVTVFMMFDDLVAGCADMRIGQAAEAATCGGRKAHGAESGGGDAAPPCGRYDIAS
jgi:hypothetical protein